MSKKKYELAVELKDIPTEDLVWFVRLLYVNMHSAKDRVPF